MPTSKKDFIVAAEYLAEMRKRFQERDMDIESHNELMRQADAVENAFVMLFVITSKNFDAERFRSACKP